MTKTNTFEKLLNEFINENWTNYKIWKLVEYVQEFKNLTRWQIRYKLQKLKEDEKEEKNYEEIKVLNNNVEDTKKWFELEENESWETEIVMIKENKDWLNKRYCLNIDLFSDIVYNYSSYWANRSWKWIRESFNLKPEVWTMLKGRLDIYKDTNAIHPLVLDHIKEKYWEKALENKIEEASVKSFEDKYKKKFIKTHDDLIKKEVKRQGKILSNIEYFYEEFNEYLSNYKPYNFNYNNINKLKIDSNTTKNEVIAFSDIHLWVWDNKIEEYFKNLQKYVTNLNTKQITFVCWWDLIETIIDWWMHPGQVEWMDWVFWFELILKMTKLLKDLIYTTIQSWKNVKFIWIWWNHDRIWRDNKENQERTAALVIYHMLKLEFKETNLVEVTYTSEPLKSFKIWNLNLILSHWEQWKGKWKDILLEYWRTDCYNYIIFGHLHHFEGKEINNNATALYLPSFSWQWYFEKKIVVSSQRWFVHIRPSLFYKNRFDLSLIRFDNWK